MSTPLVSVVMNCYNSARYLREAIDTVLAQSYVNWEIVFWDNASTDGSAEIALSYGDPRLRYFRGEATVPLGHARNLAIARSSGEFIAFLDCDDIWLPQKLERQVPLFLADRQVGLVYSDTYFFNNDGRQKRLYGSRKPYRGRCFPQLLNQYLISLETAVVRRAALDSLDHWFDERLNMVEEYDLFVRIGLHWKVDFVPDVLAKWRVHGESWSWRRPDSFVEETTLVLRALDGLPDVHEQYPDAMAAAWRKHAQAEARAKWQKGDADQARRIIAARAGAGLSARLLWLATFVPYPAVASIYRRVTGAIVPSEN